ncbi:MAG: flagellar hook protein FlgE [Terracidiphilus sp.]|jgi:flagellar hook protein FlgE
MPNFDIPLSGLNADSTALNTIANNLSNMNTTAFKAQTTNFSDLFYQQVGTAGSGDEIQQGTGVQVASNSTDFTGGTNASTGVSTDAAINGTGFFVLDGGNGSQLYTRDGDFQVSSDGKLESTSGQPVMGYSATNGVINANGALSDITIPTSGVMAPSATTTFSMTQNLDSAGSSASGPVTVYDSLGNSYVATVNYTKTGTNTWTYSISMPDKLTPASTTTGGTTTINYDFGASGGTLATVDTGSSLTITAPATAGGTATTALPTFTGSPETVADYVRDLNTALGAAGITVGAGGVTVSSTAAGVLTISGANVSTSGTVIQDPVSANTTGTLTFNSSGNLVNPAGDVSGISFSGLSDGAAAVNMTWDIAGSAGTGNITQTASANSTTSPSQNGYTGGEYESFSIGSDGTVSATYSNGQSQNVGQLALATVTNEQGLADLGSTEYQTTAASGQASVGVAGTGGRGTIQGSSLEASNVNISAEFSDLIVAQRAFEANSKAVTTFDSITQETINMIH